MIPPALHFFLKIVLAIWGLLCLNINFKILFVCFRFVKSAIGNLIGIALDLCIVLAGIIILIMLILEDVIHIYNGILFSN